MVAIIERQGFEVDAIDVFCGYGGSSQGIHAAGATVRAAANHSELAIACHQANFPDVDHWQADLSDANNPQVVNRRGKKVSGRYMDPADLPAARFAWFSPSCFPAGTLILTKRGLVPIEDVVVGDEAWTHMQRWRPVTAVWSETGDTVVLKGLGNRSLEATANHGIWARSDKPGQVKRPYRDGPADCETCGKPAPLVLGSKTKVGWFCNRDCSQRAANKRHYDRIGDPQRIEAADMGGLWWATPTRITDVPLPSFHPDVDWWWLGRWVGDGWTSNSAVIICCGKHEEAELESRLAGWRKKETPTTYNFARFDAELLRWVNEHFGKGAANKSIPSWLLAMPLTVQREFLDGYVSADGHRAQRGGCGAVQVTCRSVSKTLAHGIRLIAANLGHAATVARVEVPPTTVIEGRVVNQSTAWLVSWWENTTKQSKARWIDDRMWSQVQGIEEGRRSQQVFNITVDDDHTYVADGIVVFNCKHHSQANAKKVYQQGPSIWDQDAPEFDEVAYANSERSRVSMMCVIRYAAAKHPELIVVENVCEAAKWGPNRDGTMFQWWLRELTVNGYEFECLFLNSMFFPPCPQSRDRMYVVAWRRGNKRPNLDYTPTAYCTSDVCGGKMISAVQTWKKRTKTWPLPRWGKYRAQYRYTCPHCKFEVHPVAWPAYSAIDWTNLGPSIAERAGLGMQPLAPNTMDRIRRGLAKFKDGPPIVIPAKSVWGVDKTVLDPLTTQTSQQDKALVTSFLVKNNGKTDETKYRSKAIVEPIGTITGSPAQALVTEGVIIPAAGNTHERPTQTRAKPLHQPLYTQHTTLAFGFAHMPFISEMRGGGSKGMSGQHPVTDPAHTVTAGGFHHGLASTPFMLNGQGNESMRNVLEAAFTVAASGTGKLELVTPGIFAKINGGPGDTSWHNSDDPLNTVTGRDTHGLVVLPWVDQWRSDPVAVSEQLATVMTHLRHALASVEAVPLENISDEDLQQVRFRMLEPDPELRRAMAFEDEYILLGSKTQMTEGLGNAVTPVVASWITEQCLATLRDEEAVA
jgi:site-specific DNA-cytosine methylase